MFCAISGKPPLHPVVSIKSKALFEKSLLVQYVTEHGEDPISKDPMTVSDIIEIDTKLANTYTNPLNSSTLNTNYSIPNLLSTLQNEWDAIMQENFLLRKKLDVLSKNLSQALYERDAAKIIAAKYMSGEKIQVPTNNVNIPTIDSNNTNSNNTSAQTTDIINYDTLVENSKAYMLKTKPIIKKINSLQKNLLKNIESCTSIKMIEGISDGISNDYPISSYNLTDVSDNFSNSIILTQIDLDTCEIVSFNDHRSVPFNHRLAAAYNLPNPNVFLGISIQRDSCGTYNIESQNDNQICHLPNERIIGLFPGEYIYNNLIPNNNLKESTYLAACASGNIYLINGSNCYPIVKTTPPSNKKDLYEGVAFHKDGLLVAFSNSHDVNIINISKPNDLAISVPINGEGKDIGIVKFSSNGYWMFVGVDENVFTYDLRKSPMTCIKTNTEGKGSTWDIIPSGKIMTAVNKHKKILTLFEYEKASNSWKRKQEVNIDIPGPVKNFLMVTLLYSNDKLGCLISTRAKSYKCIFE